MPVKPEKTPQLIDRFGRAVTYLRISVTDRCDFRCLYCMSENMQFLPRPQVLTLEELLTIGQAASELGVRKIRITGGEPLVRKNIVWLLERLARLPDVDELALTTNGSQLARMASALKQAGVRRLNISLDSLKPERFRDMTRVGDLEKVLQGIDQALSVGFERIKINSVVLAGYNDDEVLDLVDFCRDRSLDISFIEEMPLGVVNSHNRQLAFFSSDQVRAEIEKKYPLITSPESSGGPSRYYRMSGNPIRVGFISPHSHNFCDTCNRVRLTAEGRLLLCLGQEYSADLRRVVRSHPGELEPVKAALKGAMSIKPQGHDFDLGQDTKVLRFMNMTGG
ncbi:MAG: GTP 3',8-cyclase MoaA [Pseudomonadota bacterium]|nr:GTP 3',8-cyclase MoaA [Pseudomonadota bacterium]